MAVLIGGFGCGAAIFGEGSIQYIGLLLGAAAYIYECLERRWNG